MSYDRRLSVKDECVIERLERYADNLPASEPLTITRSEVPQVALWVKQVCGRDRAFPTIDAVLSAVGSGKLLFRDHEVRVL